MCITSDAPVFHGTPCAPKARETPVAGQGACTLCVCVLLFVPEACLVFFGNFKQRISLRMLSKTGSQNSGSVKLDFAHSTGSTKLESQVKSGSFARGRCRRGRSEIPIFAVNCSLSSERIREKRRKTKKSEEKRRKAKKNEKYRKSEEKRKKRKKWEYSSYPIFTNPVKNLPMKGEIL